MVAAAAGVLVLRSGDRAIRGGVQTEDGLPVPDAVVRVQASENMVLSGVDGGYRLEARGGARLTVTAWREGYLIGWASATPPADDADITLTRHYTTDNPDYDWFALDGARGSATTKRNAAQSNKEAWRLEVANWPEDLRDIWDERAAMLARCA